MSQPQVYNLCCKYHGQRVRITDKQGKVHVGKITKVDQNMVWIRPENNFGGYGFGFWGFGPGFGYGIALGAIAGVALAGAFFW